MFSDNVPSILQEIAKKYHKTPAQIAINWLISQENIITISKTSDTKHLKENLGALSFEMEKEDIEKLRKEFPEQEAVSNVEPLN
jgi:diketogulonate reductase-like aldo/keto reductase